MQQIKALRTISRRRAWPLTVFAGGVILWGLPVSSQAAPTCTDQNCPTDFIQLVSPEIQSTKTSFKFQARISQAKLPVDDVEFPKVIVKLKDGVNVWCSQTLSKVKVRDSVLNIEVGPDTGMTCSMPLAEVIANKNGLGFQICINNEENCLKPIALSSVPYAVKSEFARRAQQAQEADTAAQAHYAHRMAADLDLFQSPSIGTGYYDFHTPLTATTVAGLATPVSNKEGVMQWTPVASAEKKLNICVKTEANGAVPATLQRLDELKLHAILTRGLGKLEVTDTTKLFSTLDVTGATSLLSTLGVTGATTLNTTLLTKGAATLQSTLAVTGATTLASTLGVTGATTLASTLGVSGATTLNTTLLTKGATTLQSTLGVAGLTTLSGGLTVAAPPVSTSHSITGPTSITGATQMSGTLSITAAGGLDVAAISNLTTLKVPSTGSATFDGPVTFNGLVTLPPAGVSTSSLSLTGALTLPLGSLEMGSADNIVFGHSANQIAAGVVGATIAGGGTVDGGANGIAAPYGFIGGGKGNKIVVGATHTTIGGGHFNQAGGAESTIAGGDQNATTVANATIGGGFNNFVIATGGTVGGGMRNRAQGQNSTIAGGSDNVTNGTSNFAVGASCRTAGAASVAMGQSSQATADNTFVLGSNGRAIAKGCFVWGDASGSTTACTDENRFVARAHGGVQFWTSATSNIILGAGAVAWPVGSDRNIKHDIKQLDSQDVLKKLEGVPIATWRYNSEASGALHMGPMAQDFYAAFGLGDDDKHIVTVDADGVALAAVKGVHAITKEQAKEIETLTRELSLLRGANKTLETRLAKLESGAAPQSIWHGGTGMLGGLGFASLGLMLVATRRRKDLP